MSKRHPSPAGHSSRGRAAEPAGAPPATAGRHSADRAAPAPSPVPHPRSLDERLKRVALLVGWMIVAGGVVWALSLLGPVLAGVARCAQPFAVALVLAYIFYPVVTLAQKRLGLGRVGGIFAVALVLMLLVGGFVGVLLPVLWSQGAAFFRVVEESAPKAQAWVQEMAQSPRTSAFAKRLLEWVQGLNLDFAALSQEIMGRAPQLTHGGVQAVGSVLSAVGGVVAGVGGFGSSAVLVLMIAFYFLAEFDAIPGLVRASLPAPCEDRTMAVLGRVNESLSGYLRGQLTVCALMALLASIGLWLIGMRQYAVLVGVLAGLANLVPYLGPVAGATPAILWALLTPEHPAWSQRLLHAGLVVALFVAIQTLDGFVFQPRIVGRASNLHPLAVIAALIVGGQFGLPGLILALPLACVARVLILDLWWEPHVARKRAAQEEEAQP